MTDPVRTLKDRPELQSTLLESILNHLPHPVLLIAGRSPYELLFANSVARELFQSPEGDSGSPAEWTDIADSLSFNSPDALKQVMPAMVLAGTSGEASQAKCTVTRPDGTSRRLIAHAANVDGNLLYSFYDTTRLQIAEQELADARAELEQTAYSITENIPIGTYTMVLRPGDALANFVFMSSKFLQITGLTREEAQENPLKAFACVHPEDFDEWVEKNARTFVSKTPFREETRLLIDGKVSWIIAESVPRMQEDGTWIWEGVIQDITAQKLAEIALRDATEKLIESTRLNSRIEERQRMLRDLHDGFGNQLAVGKLQLRRGVSSAAHAEQILDDCLADLKLLFESLDTDDDGLLPVLVNIRQRMDDRTQGLTVKLLWDIGAAEEVRLEPRATLQAARIVQEALANALRHARAQNITVTVCDRNDGTCLVIEDDGIGFDLTVPPAGRGLLNMRHRAQQQGWQLNIQSKAGGTRIQVKLR